MKKLNKQKAGALVAVAVCCLLIAVNADAATVTFGTMATKSQTALTNFKSAAVNFFYAVGVILAGGGIWGLYKEQKMPNQGYAKKGGVAFLVGVALLALPKLIGAGASTVGLSSSDTDSAIEADTGF